MLFVIFTLLTKNQTKSVSVNSFANICPFTIHKNKDFPTNSDKIFLSFCSGVHVQSKASPNLIGQRARICQGSATHKQKQHCSHEHFLTLPFSIIITQARGAEIALLSSAISGDYTTAQFKQNMPQHNTAQGKENLPAPSVSSRATAWRSC